MGMPKGTRWKRLAVLSDVVNQEHGPDLAHLLWANRIEYEWWNRSAPKGAGNGQRARCTVDNLMREDHIHGEEWCMVRRGDWPIAFVLAKSLGVSL